MIDIKGLTFNACHGVLEEEKVAPQPFAFDIRLEFDSRAARSGDDVSFTVNYAEVCECVKKICLGNSFNLIEKLADSVLRGIMDGFPLVDSAVVTVHKPHAPVDCDFTDISYTQKMCREKVVLSLGSSQGDRKAYLDGALKALKALDGLKILKVSDYIETQPYGGVAEGQFLNCACLAECLLSPRELLDAIHEIERSLGRVRKVRWGDRTVDIDIIFFGNKIIAEEGICIPHPDYMNRRFVLVPLKQIVPDFVCPKLLKRVSDM